MPDDYSQDQNFLAASPKDQFDYLLSVDKDFAQAAPKDQAAYLAHVTTPVHQERGILETAWGDIKNLWPRSPQQIQSNVRAMSTPELKQAISQSPYASMNNQAKQNFVRRLSEGRGLPYAMTATTLENVLPVNVAGMEQASSPSEVLGHALAGAAITAGPSLLHEGIPAAIENAPKIPELAQQAADSAGRILRTPGTLETPKSIQTLKPSVQALGSFPLKYFGGPELLNALIPAHPNPVGDVVPLPNRMPAEYLDPLRAAIRRGDAAKLPTRMPKPAPYEPYRATPEQTPASKGKFPMNPASVGAGIDLQRRISPIPEVPSPEPSPAYEAYKGQPNRAPASKGFTPTFGKAAAKMANPNYVSAYQKEQMQPAISAPIAGPESGVPTQRITPESIKPEKLYEMAKAGNVPAIKELQRRGLELPSGSRYIVGTGGGTNPAELARLQSVVRNPKASISEKTQAQFELDAYDRVQRRRLH